MSLMKRVGYRAIYLLKYSWLQIRYKKKWNLNSLDLSRPAAGKPVLTAILRVQNEDYWIELIIRTLSKLQDEIQIIVIDSGSTDRTLKILQLLQLEGCQMSVYRHKENWVSNPLVNLLLERVAQGTYFYIVDGDDIQLEPSLRKLALACTNNQLPVRYCMHYRHFRQNDVTRITKKQARSVKFMIGRAFKRDTICFSRYHPLDSLAVKRDLAETICWFKKRPGKLTTGSAFLASAFVLHAALIKRSSISTWDGYNSMGMFRALSNIHEEVRNQYRGSEDEFVTTEIFPKELFELKYSAHNEEIALLKKLPNIDYV